MWVFRDFWDLLQKALWNFLGERNVIVKCLNETGEKLVARNKTRVADRFVRSSVAFQTLILVKQMVVWNSNKNEKDDDSKQLW